MNEPIAQAGPEIPHNRERAERTARVALRQDVWEASQFMSYDEIREYVEAVLREIESDEP